MQLGSSFINNCKVNGDLKRKRWRNKRKGKEKRKRKRERNGGSKGRRAKDKSRMIEIRPERHDINTINATILRNKMVA